MLNKAHMMKLAQSILTDPNKLWVRMMKAKYSCGMNIIPKFNLKTNSSCTWRAIVQSWDLVKENIIWIIKNGYIARFQKDCWIPGYKPLIDQLGISVPDAEKDFPVFHYTANGTWNWNMMKQLIPPEVCEKIAVVKPPKPGNNDFPCCRLTSNGFVSEICL